MNSHKYMITPLETKPFLSSHEFIQILFEGNTPCGMTLENDCFYPENPIFRFFITKTPHMSITPHWVR